ncbi:GATA transcription factor LreA [Fusarium bulbicola]|nr:GATA transcription factor LreA [Fusarium bulbicola]
MSDPLSVTASVVGIVGALLHGSKRLYEFIDSLRNAPKDIAALSTDLRALYEILAHVTNIQDRLSNHVDLCTSLKAPLENCLNIFDEFTTLLQGFTQTSRNGTIQVRVWKQMAWAFRDKEIQLFRDTITTYKVSLDMALSAMTFSTIASLNERTKRFETDFKEEFKDIKLRLKALDNDRIELASVAGCKGSEWYGTEANFAMKRFLEYTESLCDSPPASFPGSPIQRASSDCNGVDTEQGFGMDNQSPNSAMNQEASQPFIDDGSPPKFPLVSIHYELKAQVPTASIDSITPESKDIYIQSGFDPLKALWLVAIRKNPQINLGAFDMSCSFFVCDVTLEDCPIVYASDSFQSLTGYSGHELFGRNCRFLQAPDGKARRGSLRWSANPGVVNTLKKNIQERRETKIAMTSYRKGGEPFLNHLSIIPIPWETEEIRYRVSFQTDLVEIPTAIAQTIKLYDRL